MAAGFVLAILGSTGPACGNSSTGTITVSITGFGSPTPPYTISLYSDANQLFLVTQTVLGGNGTTTFINLPPGIYYIGASDSSTIPVKTPVPSTTSQTINTGVVISGGTVNVNPTTSGGTNGSITVNASGSFNLEYKLNAGAYQFSNVFTGLVAGNYLITVHDYSAGCTLPLTATLLDPGITEVDINIKLPVSCHNGCNGIVQAIVTGRPTGTLSYIWRLNGSVVGGNTPILLNACSGDYTVEVKDSGSGADITSSVTTLINPTVIATSVVVESNISCFGGNNGEIDVVSSTGGTAPYTYHWSGPNSFTSNNPVITRLYAGTYTLVTTDSVGCTSSQTVTLTQGAQIVAHQTITNSLCYGITGGTISLAPTGGAGSGSYHYNWSTLPLVGDVSSVSGLVAGVYPVTITKGPCSASFNFTINGPLQTIVIADIIGVTSNHLGSITTSISGGTPPYTFLWSTGATTQNIINLSSGTYTITVSDSNGCSANASFEIPIDCDTFTLTNFKVFTMRLECCLGNKIKKHNELIRQGRQDLADKMLIDLYLIRMILDRFLCITSLDNICWDCNNFLDLINLGKKVCDCDCCEENQETIVQVRWNSITNKFDIIN